MSEAPELLSCPFCGGDADISHDHTVEENHAYGCRKCGLWFDTFNSDNAISDWNTRADLPATDEQAIANPRVQALVEALGDLHHAVCGETGFAECVRQNSGLAYPWPALDIADSQARAALAAPGKEPTT